MPAPLPLTQCDSPRLDWSRPGTLTAENFGDIYFSTEDGLAETESVFLGGCGLPEGWIGRAVFTIGELGFGSGLNFLAAWRMWDRTQTDKSARLNFISIEKFPLSKADVVRVLSNWPELEHYAAQLIQAWPGQVKGIHRLDFGSVQLTLIHDDVFDALDGMTPDTVDAWFLDGFNPKKNPAMWSYDVIAQLPALSRPGARLATFSVASLVKTPLVAAGFAIEKKPGHGRKRHRLEARLPGTAAPPPSISRALVIGAGIAGRSLSYALSARGIEHDVFANDQPAASQNAAALIKPRLDLQDRPESRFFLSAFLHALRTYEEMNDAVLHRGVSQIPKSDSERKRFIKLAAQQPLSDAHMCWQDERLQLPSSLVVNPEKLFPNVMVQTKEINALDAVRAEYDHIFIAAGFGIRALLPDMALRFSRGQLTWAETSEVAPVSYGGYAIPVGSTTLLGATHDRLDVRDPFETRAEDDQKNIENYMKYTGAEASPVKLASRASVRVTSADTLPVLHHDGNLSVLTGLGSRGFVFAPLLAETLVAEACGEALPIDMRLRLKLAGRDKP